MAVLAEAISVVVRRDAIERRYAGGWEAFFDEVPNSTFCTDGLLARVGFMAPGDVQVFIERLEAQGLTFLTDGNAVDIAVVDQQRGPTMPCEWLEFARLPVSGKNSKVAMCWYFDGPRLAQGLHLPEGGLQLHAPVGWTYEGSLSERFRFVPAGEEQEHLKFVRRDDGMDIYVDIESGKEVYLAHRSERT